MNNRTKAMNPTDDVTEQYSTRQVRMSKKQMHAFGKDGENGNGKQDKGRGKGKGRANLQPVTRISKAALRAEGW